MNKRCLWLQHNKNVWLIVHSGDRFWCVVYGNINALHKIFRFFTKTRQFTQPKISSCLSTTPYHYIVSYTIKKNIYHNNYYTHQRWYEKSR